MAQTEKGIIYPYDYNEVADVPSDFKALAESIDRILSDYSLNTDSGNKIVLEMNNTTYKIKAVLKDKDDNVIDTSNEIDLPLENMVTNISYNNQILTLTHQDGQTTEVSIADLISDLASKEEVEELQSKISDLETLVETELESNSVEGTEIDVSDSAEYRGRIEVKGNTEQKQLSGKNLFDFIANLNTPPSGLTISTDNNDNIIVSGTPASNWASIVRKTNITDLLEDGETYTLWQENTEANGQFPWFYAQIGYGVDSPSSYLGIQNNSHTRTFTVNKSQYNVYQINVQTGNNKVQFNNIKNRFMLLKGDYTNQNVAYEPYCGGQASPNPLYPQNIEVVTGDNVIKHVGKNLFDKNNVNILNALINSNGTLVSSSAEKTLYIKCKPNTTYTISKIAGKRLRADERSTVPTIGSANVNRTLNDTGTSLTFTTTENGKYLLVGYYVNTDEATEQQILDSIQIEEGTTPTPYEPYREESYNLDLWKENEFDSENATVLDAYFSEDGKMITSSNKSKTLYIPCKANCTYKITKKLSARFRLLTTNVLPDISVIGDNYIFGDLVNCLKITTGSNAKYLCVFFYNSDYDTLTVQEILDSIQIQEAIELCKIGDYEDILFQNEVGDENYNAELEDGAWYKKSAIAEVILDGKETWNYNSGNRYFFTNKFLDNYVTQYTKLVSNNYIGGMASNGGLYNNHIQTGTAYSFMICDNRFTDKNDLKTWLSTHNTIVKYPLATPTYEKITDTTLISQLEALKKAKWFKGINHWWTETENLEPNLKGTYKQSNNLRLQALEQAVVALGGV